MWSRQLLSLTPFWLATIQMQMREKWVPTTLTSFAASNVNVGLFYASTNESHFQHMQRIQYKFNTEYHVLL